MERLKRYEKQIVAVMSAFVILVGGVLSTSFDSFASGVSDTTEFYVSYPEPSTGLNNGYFCVLYQNTSTGQYCLNTYFWTIYHSPDIDNVVTDGYMSMSVVNNSNTVTFTPVVEGYDIETYMWQFAEYTSHDYLDIHRYGAYSVDGNYSYSYNYGAYGRVVGTIYGGNVSYVKGFDRVVPTVHWSNSVDAIELRSKLTQILTELRLTHSDIEGMLSKVTDIYNSNLRIESKLDVLEDLYREIIEEQKTSNTWLGKIWDSIQEFFNPSEDEKTDSEQFDSETTEKSDEVGDLVEESKTEKPDVDDMSDSIDSNLDMTSANEYGAVLLNITENEYILQMLLIVVTVAIIAYVLFGKR